MPMDLRNYLDILEREGMLFKVEKEVDWKLEAACIATMMNRVGEGKYALLFENVKDYYPDKGRLLSCMFSPNRRRYWEKASIAMGLSRDVSYGDFRREFMKRIRKPIKPIEISKSDAPCKEVIKMGKDVNLLDFPIPFIHSKDGGRYITMNWVINQDPDTGWTNIGNYRWMIKDRRRGAALWTMGQHGPTIHFLKHEMRGQTCPVCIAVGGDPLGFLASTAMVGAGVCEYDLLGGLRGEPLEVVRAETNNLLVPASAELVIEAELRPGERTDEGPFGEYTGFTHGRSISPIFRVNCITYRKNPIIPFCVEGTKWYDGAGGSIYGMDFGWYEYVHDVMGIKGVNECHLTLDSAGGLLVTGLDPSYPGEVSKLAQTLFGFKATVTTGTSWVINDPDIDLTDNRDPLEEIALNFDPRTLKEFTSDQDTFVSPLFFYTDVENRFRGTDGAKFALDCTTKFKPWSYPRKAIFEKAYPSEIQKYVKKNFSKLGFDEPFDDKSEPIKPL